MNGETLPTLLTEDQMYAKRQIHLQAAETKLQAAINIYGRQALKTANYDIIEAFGIDLADDLTNAFQETSLPEEWISGTKQALVLTLITSDVFLSNLIPKEVKDALVLKNAVTEQQ